MGPFRHCHRNAYEGFVQSFVFLVSASSIFNRSFLLGDSPHNLRFFSIVARTLKTAHPNFNHLALDQFHQFSLWSHLTLLNSLDQVLDRLVSASFIRYRTFTADLSPGSLPGVLLLSNGILILEVGFTLRCLQRLSRPHFASQLCPWQDNCCTSDAFTPVLSY